jgi:HsdM N-terminal domain
MNHGEIVSFIWGVADLIRDTFKRGKYQDVILPLTVLRRLDCVLAPTKEKVLKRQAGARVYKASMPSFARSPDSSSTTRRATISKSFSLTRRTSRRTCVITSPGLAQYAGSAGKVRLRQHNQQAGRCRPPLPSA